VSRQIAALYVEAGGCYYGLPGVDPWDEARDARLYAGPHPVVAHPPCQRWGRFWFGGTNPTSKRYQRGDDGGCFAAALSAVRKWGGVLEHPAGSYAWREFGLNAPPLNGCWVNADFEGGWTCCVDQGAYGHRARKTTWLYANGVDLPSLKWGRAKGNFMLLRAVSVDRMAERGIESHAPVVSRRECIATPEPFRDLLISMARSVVMETTHA
jgi:hypothetical protein